MMDAIYFRQAVGPVRDQKAAGSNPATSTERKPRKIKASGVLSFCLRGVDKLCIVWETGGKIAAYAAGSVAAPRFPPGGNGGICSLSVNMEPADDLRK